MTPDDMANGLHDSKSNWVYPIGFMPHVHVPDVMMATPMSSGGATNSLGSTGDLTAQFRCTNCGSSSPSWCNLLLAIWHGICYCSVEQVAHKDNATLMAINQRLRADKRTQPLWDSRSRPLLLWPRPLRPLLMCPLRSGCCLVSCFALTYLRRSIACPI